jgi:hypothetical protein
MIDSPYLKSIYKAIFHRESSEFNMSDHVSRAITGASASATPRCIPDNSEHTSVPSTPALIAIPLICFGPIDRRHLRRRDGCGYFSNQFAV